VVHFPLGEKGATLRAFFRRADAVGYFEGEEFTT
jgi:hypothetical protein